MAGGVEEDDLVVAQVYLIAIVDGDGRGVDTLDGGELARVDVHGGFDLLAQGGQGVDVVHVRGGDDDRLDGEAGLLRAFEDGGGVPAGVDDGRLAAGRAANYVDEVRHGAGLHLPDDPGFNPVS